MSHTKGLPERSRREHIARCRRISCRKAYRKSRRDLYRIPVGEDRIFPFRCCGGRMLSAPTDSLARMSRAKSLPERSRREHIARCRRISCRKAYRASVGEDRIFPFRCCGGRMLSAPTGSLARMSHTKSLPERSRREHIARRRRISCRKAYRNISHTCRGRSYLPVPLLRRADAIRPYGFVGENVTYQKPSPRRGRWRGLPSRMRWIRRKAERFSRINELPSSCGASMPEKQRGEQKPGHDGRQHGGKRHRHGKARLFDPDAAEVQRERIEDRFGGA